MSHECNMIVVSAPTMRTTSETLAIRGLKCGYCQGNGYFWGLDDIGQSEKKPCPICKGSGKVDAEVRIEYKAAAQPQRTKPSDNDYKPFND